MHVLPQVLLRAGDRLSAAEVGILASVGAAYVSTHPSPCVAVLSTGDELARPDTPAGALPFGAVRDSNRPMLLAGARARLLAPSRACLSLTRSCAGGCLPTARPWHCA